MDFKKKLQGYFYDCVEPLNHWLPWIWLNEGQIMWSYTGCVRSNRGSLKFNKKGNNLQYEKNKSMRN